MVKDIKIMMARLDLEEYLVNEECKSLCDLCPYEGVENCEDKLLNKILIQIENEY